MCADIKWLERVVTIIKTAFVIVFPERRITFYCAYISGTAESSRRDSWFNCTETRITDVQRFAIQLSIAERCFSRKNKSYGFRPMHL